MPSCRIEKLPKIKPFLNRSVFDTTESGARQVCGMIRTRELYGGSFSFLLPKHVTLAGSRGLLRRFFQTNRKITLFQTRKSVITYLVEPRTTKTLTEKSTQEYTRSLWNPPTYPCTWKESTPTFRAQQRPYAAHCTNASSWTGDLNSTIWRHHLLCLYIWCEKAWPHRNRPGLA